MKSLRILSGVISVALALTVGACKDTRRSADAPSSQAKIFVVRGQVVQVPVEGKPGSQFLVHHEAIPDFIGEDGTVVGMGVMTMYFPTATGLSLASVYPGEKIQFTLSVDWPNNRVEITEITPLPADTKLDFGERSATPESAVP